MIPSTLLTRMVASESLRGYAKKKGVLRTHKNDVNTGFSKTQNEENAFSVEVARRLMFTKSLLNTLYKISDTILP